MSSSPMHEDLAELAARRLDGELADEAWQALERQHGEALARALARETATREALRALPREGAPRQVLDAIRAHAAAAPAPPRAAPAGGGASLRWWSGAAILAAACLVTGIVLRVDRGDAPTNGPAAASTEPRVARAEPTKERGEERRQLSIGAAAHASEESAARNELDGATDKLARLENSAKAPAKPAARGDAAFGADDAKRADGEAGQFQDAQSEPLAKLEKPAKKGEDFDRLRDDATAWRATNPAAPAASPPKTVLEQAGAADAVIAAKAKPTAAADAEKAGGAPGRAPAAADDEAAEAAPVIAKVEPERADRKDAKAADVAPAQAPAGISPGRVAAQAPAEQPKQFKQQGASGDAGGGGDARRSAATVLALLALDGTRAAVMTLENHDAAPLLVRRASLTLEGVGADGAAVWTLTTGQPESDATLPASARGSWRAPLAGAAALQGATRLRLRFREIVSPEVAWPPAPPAAAVPPAETPPATPPATAPAKP